MTLFSNQPAAQFQRAIMSSSFKSCFRASMFLAIVAVLLAVPAVAQEYVGPFVPHRGQVITTTFTNEFGRDADSTTFVVDVTNDAVVVEYSSTRGISTRREILIADREGAPAYVLGYAPRMPALIPGTTSLGISAAVLSQLRSAGNASLSLVYSQNLDRIDCLLTTTGVDAKVPVIVEDRVFDIPTVQARIDCSSGERTGSGNAIFANDVNNPILIESVLSFNWETRPRTERVTRVTAGRGLHSDMQQALDTLGTYDVYGLHFDFDSAELRPETAQLVGDIARMLQSNANWVVQIGGHTDSVGGAEYNLKLSAARAESVSRALVAQGVAAERLQPVGFGESRPRADNDTIAGRAINRRVEFRRLDR